MLHRRILLLAALLTLALFITPVRAQQNAFTLESKDPVIVHGKSAGMDRRYTDPGAVLFHDGKFHMFRNGFNSWPDAVQVFYHTSPDGITWTQEAAGPVLRSKDVPFAKLAALASSALVEDDGTWVLYFYTWEARNSRARTTIGRATASAPTGPWSVDPEPVLQPGAKGSWDDLRVMGPRVVKTADGYVMYYTGSTRSDSSKTGDLPAIGMATSTDGKTWTKHDDAATTDVAYAASDPVLRSADPALLYHQPIVFKTSTGWEMVLRSMAAESPGNSMALRHAASADGIRWTVTAGDPVWTIGSLPGSSAFWWTAGLYHDGKYYLYVEGQRGSVTDIYVATYKGDLPR